MNKEVKKCQNCKKEFIIKAEDFNFYKKIKVPTPSWCPECRRKRRFIWWGEYNLYKKKEALEGKRVFSTYSEQSPIKIYDHDYWWSDNWDALEYGQDYDFSQSFFEQIKKLLYQVPLPSRDILSLINSDYSNKANNLKNCYLCFNIGSSENCLYCKEANLLKDCLEILLADKCELCYETFSTTNCYKTFFSKETSYCRNVWFSLNCTNCSDCFGCVNLTHKRYHIFNKPYSKQKYEQKIKEFNLGSYNFIEKIKKRVEKLYLTYPVKYIHGIKNSGKISGDYIYQSKNTTNCYSLLGGENCHYSQGLLKVKDVYDYSNWGDKSELIYESVESGNNNYNIKFSYNICNNNKNIEYSISCFSCSNLFGCVGLHKKQYCILNKQYTKKDYEKLVFQIKKQMNEMPYIDQKDRVYKYGEFFPLELSPFCYNETKLQEYYPLKQEEIVKQGFKWKKLEERNIRPDFKTEDLPDNIKDVTNNILEKTIQCAHAKIEKDGILRANCKQQCTTAFKITARELDFYRKMNLPLPRLCPNCRYYERIKKRNPIKIYKRKCMCNRNNTYKNKTKHVHGNKPCYNEFKTSYNPSKKEIIYCEKCYNQEIT